MTELKILDCTLRDGGYINNWNFGYKTIKNIIEILSKSNIDYIECGFYNDSILEDKEKTMFNCLKSVNELIPEDSNNFYTIMINYGEADIENFSLNNQNIELRITFKPHQLRNTIFFSQQLQDKGYKISLNPMHTSLYSNNELDNLINKTNKLNPECLTVVDTMGIMDEEETKSIFTLLNKEINPQIALGFHSHNNLQLSLKNIQELIDLNLERKIIVDSCLLGMSRGAGMIQTEIIAEYLNNRFNKSYNLETLINVCEKYITQIKREYNWQYSYHYYLSAKHHCHPNYAEYIKQHTHLDLEEVEKILAMIPEAEKIIYNKSFIEKLLLFNSKH